MQNAEIVTFGGASFDRMAAIRGDEKEVLRLFESPDARTVPLWRDRIAATIGFRGKRSILWLETRHPVLRDPTMPPLFLGCDGHAPKFAQDISSWEPGGLEQESESPFALAAVEHPLLAGVGEFIDLRQTMTEYAPNDAALAATAKAMIGWHRSHAYCANCGENSRFAGGGWWRDCPGCRHQHFCRTDPVVIMVIRRGNRLLLGRSWQWPKGMYSLLAGFVEPGELIHEAVRREVQEETSVAVGDVRILASQPWPFPSSLMIGCVGEAKSEEITVDRNEIEDAFWISREDMLHVFAGLSHDIRPPRKGSIARFLIQNWLAGQI